MRGTVGETWKLRARYEAWLSFRVRVGAKTATHNHQTFPQNITPNQAQSILVHYSTHVHMFLCIYEAPGIYLQLTPNPGLDYWTEL